MFEWQKGTEIHKKKDRVTEISNYKVSVILRETTSSPLF